MLTRYVRTSYTLAWVGMIEQEVVGLFGRKPSLTDLATLYPVENEYKRELNRPGTQDFNASKTKWSRLKNGKTSIAEGEMTARIERRYPHLVEIRKHPVWRIFENPLMSTPRLLKLIQAMEPTLGNKLFFASGSKLGLSYKSLFWTQENFKLVESLEAFTLKLALYRIRKLGLLGEDWPISEKDLILHLFRICTQPPWRSIADRLLRLFWIFLCTNDQGGLSEAEADYGLKSAAADMLYHELFQRIAPKHSNFLVLYSTIERYLQANHTLIQNFWLDCGPKLKISTPVPSFSSKVLFWADRASDLWLSQNATKETIFIVQPELFDMYCQRVMFFGCRKQIW